MRIGEMLVEQRKLRQSDLARALSEKADKRLASFLIAKGLVDFDDASRALGEQKGYPCALAKHLAGRDPALAKLIPPELGRSSCVLPIGRSSQGVVVVGVRDPTPALLAALKQATNAEITMVVAPASRLEHLIADSYGSAPRDEYDIDFNSEVDTNPLKLDLDPNMPPLPEMDALDPESVRLALTDLDDERVDKDPSQSLNMSSQAPRTPTLPPATYPTSTPPTGSPHLVPRRAPDPRATRPMSLEGMQLGLDHATSREAATDLVLAYIGTRWTSGLVLAIRDNIAIGYRGHGVPAAESIAIPLSSPSTVQRAVETRFVSVHVPRGAAQEALSRALGSPNTPAAAPVSVNGQPVAVIAVGDPIGGSEHASADLGILGEALGAAYQRMLGR